jgi:hypothetical protein
MQRGEGISSLSGAPAGYALSIICSGPTVPQTAVLHVVAGEGGMLISLLSRREPTTTKGVRPRSNSLVCGVVMDDCRVNCLCSMLGRRYNSWP